MKMIDEITNETLAKFSHSAKGIMYYIVETDFAEYILPVDVDEMEKEDEEFPKETTVLYLMKYMRRALSKGAFLRIPKK